MENCNLRRQLVLRGRCFDSSSFRIKNSAIVYLFLFCRQISENLC